jgi:hypothetical protein
MEGMHPEGCIMLKDAEEMPATERMHPEGCIREEMPIAGEGQDGEDALQERCPGCAPDEWECILKDASK